MKLFFATSLLATALTPAFAGNPLNFEIVNNRSEDVWIYFANKPITGTYNGSPILTNIANSDSSGYKIAAQSSLTGFSISNFDGGRILVSVGSTLNSGNGSEFNNSSLTDFSKRFDKFELTYFSNPSLGQSDANLTATDWTGVPMKLQTNNPSSVTQSVEWSGNFNDALGNVINNSVVNKTTNHQGSNVNGLAIVTGPNGVVVNGIADPVVRVIAPSTTSDSANIPYAEISNYVTSVKDNQNPIHVKGTGFGTNYDLNGTVNASGNVVLTGQIEGVNTTLELDKQYLTSFQVYGANPNLVSFNNIPKGHDQQSESERAAVRDIYAGFNLGVWGSTEDINGTQLGNLSSEEFFALHSVQYFFSAAQPSHPDFYNQFAEQLALNSNNSVYGFPYSDVLGGQLVTFDPNQATPTLTLTIQPDSVAPVPVPAAVWLFGSAFAALGVFGVRKSTATTQG